MFSCLGAYQCVWVRRAGRLAGADPLRWGCAGREGLPGGRVGAPQIARDPVWTGLLGWTDWRLEVPLGSLRVKEGGDC